MRKFVSLRKMGTRSSLNYTTIAGASESLRDSILELLDTNKPCTSIQIASQLDLQGTIRKVNSMLMDLEREGLVSRKETNPVTWFKNFTFAKL